MAAGTVELAALETGVVSLTSGQVEDLDSGTQGPLLSPGDAGWDDAVLIWNGMMAKSPALVLQPTSAQDVAAAIGFAKAHGVLLSIKGGGHNIAGTSLAQGGLTLDMSRLREVTVDHEARLVHVGAGCLIKHVDLATQEHGLATTLGFVSETGVAGLTVGGGFGYLTRRFGWTVDELQEVEIVTADGRVRVANRQEHDDLFWGIRGGGGNLGVVTRFTYRLHEVGPSVTGGMIVWSADRAEEVLRTYREVAESSPRELTLVASVRLAPPAPFLPEEVYGTPITAIIACHTGPNAEADLAPVRALGDPLADIIVEKPYTAQQSMLDATQPKGMHYYWKTEFLPGLSDGYLEALREGGRRITSRMSQAILFQLGGALNEHDEDDGAMGNRDARFVSGFAASWTPDGEPEAHVAWARESWETIRPFSTGGNYVNFQVADDDSGRTADAYRGNFERLQRVKVTYDPDNLFRVNRNVSPSG